MFTTIELNELAAKYVACIKDKKLKISQELRNDFLALLKSDDFNDRNDKWNIIKNKYKPRELKKLANPYFIGYGKRKPNTKQKVLFLGKEKAFNIAKYPKLFLWESINNILQWQKITEGKSDKLDFDPRFPQQTFKKEKKSHAHTWAKYSTILNELFEEGKAPHLASFVEKEDVEKSFFSKCFLTEINYMPSPSSKGNDAVKKTPFFEKRETFLRETIIRHFEVIIIGAWAYFNTENENELEIELTNLFGKVERVDKTDYSDNESFPYLHYRGIENNQQIFITKQLSNLSKWFDDRENRKVTWGKGRVSTFAKRINIHLR